MAIIKKRKAEGFRTRAEFEAAIDRIAELSVKIDKDEATLKMRHQQLDAKYNPELTAMRDEVNDLVGNAEVYFGEHESELCRPGTKTGETKLAFFGVKIGMPTVVKNIRDAWKAIAARWSANAQLSRFVRTAVEIDKDLVLAAFRDGGSVDDQTAIREAGLNVEQEPRQFWVRPRADEQVKSID